MKRISFFLFFAIFFVLCTAQKVSTKSFSPCSNLMELNGTYLNKENMLSSLFSIDSKTIHSITFDFESKNKLKLTYRTSSGLDSIYYKGKFKKNYFEIHFSNILIPIPFFFVKSIDRIRIGHNETSDLLIQHYDSHLGWLVFFAAGDDSNDEHSFQNMLNFNGLKPYFSDGKWGFTDSLQNIKIEPTYDFVEFFEYGVSRIKQNGKWGLINEQGAELTPVKYDSIHPFHSSDRAKILLDGKEGYLNSHGQEIIPPVYDIIYDVVYHDSNIPIKIALNGKMGFIDANGEEIIPPVYDDTHYIADGILRITLNDKKGCLDKQGNVLIPPVYDDIQYIANGFIKITSNGKKGYLDKQGNVLIPPMYETLGNITDSSSVVVFAENGKYGYRTITDIVCPPILDNASDGFTADLKDLCEYFKQNDILYARVVYKGNPYLLDKEGYMYQYKCNRTIRKGFTVFVESRTKVTELGNGGV